jgi:tetratricopeptide (TPR) repeat protein
LLLEQAAAAANQHEHMQAIHLYTEVLALTDPQAAEPMVRSQRLVALRERGRLFNLLGEAEAALAGYEQVLLEAGNSRHAVDALVFIGNQCTYMNRSERAIEAHRQALQLAESLNYTAGRANALGGLGLVFTYLDRSEEALRYLHRSLALLEQIGDKVELARCWNRIGVSHLPLGELDKAIRAFQSSSSLAHEVGESEPIAMETAIISLSNLGECYQSLFAMDQALASHQQALAMAEKTELPYLEADLCRNLGVDLTHLGRVDEGVAWLYRSLLLSVETGQPDVEIQAMYGLAMGEIQRGNLDQGRELAEQLREMAQKNGNQGSMAEALYALGRYHECRGELDASQRMWQQALFQAHETGRRVLLWQVHGALARIATHAELARVHYRIAAEIVQQIAQPIGDDTLREAFLRAQPVRLILDQAAAPAKGSG